MCLPANKGPVYVLDNNLYFTQKRNNAVTAENIQSTKVENTKGLKFTKRYSY